MSQVQDVTGAVLPDSVSEVDRNARRAMWGSAIGYAMDGFDLLILGFMLNAISSDLHLTSVQAASLVTATLVGAVVGGFGFGMLSDRLGRVRVLTWTIVVFAVFTGMCALAQGYWDLLVYEALPVSAWAGNLVSGWRWWPRLGPPRNVRAPARMWDWDGSSVSWPPPC